MTGNLFAINLCAVFQVMAAAAGDIRYANKRQVG